MWKGSRPLCDFVTSSPSRSKRLLDAASSAEEDFDDRDEAEAQQQRLLLEQQPRKTRHRRPKQQKLPPAKPKIPRLAEFQKAASTYVLKSGTGRVVVVARVFET